MSKKLFLLLVLAFYCSSLQAQDITGSGVWFGNDLKYLPSKKIDINFSCEYREVVTPPQFGALLFEPSLDYNFSKHLTLSAGYRFDIRQDYLFRHRSFADISYDAKLVKKISATFRMRYQKDFQIGEFNDNYLRPKLSVKYKLSKKISPFVYGEIFYHLWFKGNQFDDIRISGGINYDFTKKYSVKLYYLNDKEFNVSFPLTQSVIGISFGEDF